MKAKTYEEWKELGYQVRKGEHSTGVDKNGHRTFTRDQTEDEFPDSPGLGDYCEEEDRSDER
jgi:antirestriction protein ArdC